MKKASPFGRLVVGACLAFPSNAVAQRASENVIRSAEDAFGRTLGNESIGIYDSSNVRGFSPSAAGNVRVEGLYADQPAGLSTVVQSGYSIYIGPAQQGMPFPAPTGIVNYSLRNSGPDIGGSLYASAGPIGTYFYQLDGRFPIDKERLSIAMGAAQSFFQSKWGGHSVATSFGAIPHWQPAPGVDVKLVYNRSLSRGGTASTLILSQDSFVPDLRMPRDRYLGPSWARSDIDSENTGLIAGYLSGPWTLRVGAFTSAYGFSRSYSDFLVAAQNGSVQRLVSIAPGASGWAHSGEIRLSRQIGTTEKISQLLTLSLRARDRVDRYGDAQQFDFGRYTPGQRFSGAEPKFVPGALTLDATQQMSVGVSNMINLNKLAELSIGVQRTDYKKKVSLPDFPSNSSRTKAWLFNSSMTGNITSHLGAYASYVTGFEEGGTAPGWSTNANEVLPAFRTKQWDAGIQWKPSKSVTAILGYFAIRKPYIGVSQALVFRSLGEEYHKGLEVSLVTNPSQQLTFMAGGVWARNRVQAREDATETLGREPVGQPRWTVSTGFDYRLPHMEGFSIDGNANLKGKQAGTVDNQAILPTQTTISLGARYMFKAGKMPITLRAYLDNLFDQYRLLSAGSQAYYPSSRRSFNLTCSVDF